MPTPSENAIRNERSEGHVTFLGDFEYFHADGGCLYRANRSNVIDVRTRYRTGAQFECMPRVDNHVGYVHQLSKDFHGW